MNPAYKTEPQQWADIINILETALSNMSIAGVSVERAYQPTKGNFDRPYLLIHRLRTDTVGFQKNKTFIDAEGKVKKTMQDIQRIEYQIDSMKKLKPGSTADLTAFDILQQVKLWLNSDEGCAYIRSKGYSNLKAADINQPQLVNENDVWETHPNINFVVYYVNNFVKDGQLLKGVVDNIKRI